MSSAEPAIEPTMERRGYISPSRRVPAKEQLAALLAAGCGVIYVQADKFRRWERGGVEGYENDDAGEQWLASLRKGWLGVVVSLARTASRYEGVLAVVEKAHQQDSAIMETSTGRRSDDIKALPGMLADAKDELAGIRSRPWTADEARAAAVAKAQAGKLETDHEKLRAMWLSPAGKRKYPTASDVVAASGYSRQFFHTNFGPRYPNDPSRGGRPKKS